MKVFWVFAHPEPRSLSAALKDFGVEALKGAGHGVEVSDLYGMNWNPVAGPADFPARVPTDRLEYMAASRAAYESGTQRSDIEEEQHKLLGTDVLILQFPLWWFSMPAILKGWVDRTFANGLAYGLSDPDWPGRSLRYGKGRLTGRRAFVIVTTSARDTALGPRGVGGDINDLLFPIHHGILFYAGMQVLPPFLVHSAGRTTPDRYSDLCAELRERLLTAATSFPIPYRLQNSSDYDDDLALRPGLEGDAHGFAIHIRPTTDGSQDS